MLKRLSTVLILMLTLTLVAAPAFAQDRGSEGSEQGDMTFEEYCDYLIGLFEDGEFEDPQEAGSIEMVNPYTGTYMLVTPVPPGGYFLVTDEKGETYETAQVDYLSDQGTPATMVIDIENGFLVTDYKLRTREIVTVVGYWDARHYFEGIETPGWSFSPDRRCLEFMKWSFRWSNDNR